MSEPSARRSEISFAQLPSGDIAARLMCRSLLISANARRRQQGERHAHPLVRVLAGGSDVDRKLLMAETQAA